MLLKYVWIKRYDVWDVTQNSREWMGRGDKWSKIGQALIHW